MAEVQLPQLGESVTEGIITRWLVDVGDTVNVDQAIAEISTDKVDTEIPSPVAGTIKELRFDVDDTVEVGQVIAVITEGEPAEPANGNDQPDNSSDTATEQPEPDTKPETTPEPTGPAQPAAKPARSAALKPAPQRASGPVLASPLVRRLLRDAGVDAARVEGSGPGGRVTREDAERAIAEGVATPATVGTAGPSRRERPGASPLDIEFGGERSVTQDLSRIRKAIARSMMDSLHNSAQLTAAVEADLTSVMHLRNRLKDDFKAREGASLTPLAIIARAVCMTLPRHPALNASIDQEAGTATYHNYINLGIAVDTERGLLVPNLKDAGGLDAAGIARAIGDVAKRTRDRKLNPDEITGGTFTITNTGSMGTLFDTPILNPPEAAILATPAIEKRPVVISDGISDAIAIRWMTYLCLTYDHRIVDGADAARFLQDLKWVLEEHDFAGELGG